MKKIILTALLISSGAFAKPAKKSVPPPTRDEILQQYSYEQLQDAANFLEQKIANPKSHLLRCDPPTKKAKMWISGPLRSLIDAQKPNLLKSYTANPASLQIQIQNCATICQCSSYYGILEAADATLATSEIHKKNFAELKEQIKKQDKDQELACSKKSWWICRSPLVKYLESQK